MLQNNFDPFNLYRSEIFGKYSLDVSSALFAYFRGWNSTISCRFAASSSVSSVTGGLIFLDSCSFTILSYWSVIVKIGLKFSSSFAMIIRFWPISAYRSSSKWTLLSGTNFEKPLRPIGPISGEEIVFYWTLNVFV